MCSENKRCTVLLVNIFIYRYQEMFNFALLPLDGAVTSEIIPRHHNFYYNNIFRDLVAVRFSFIRFLYVTLCVLSIHYIIMILSVFFPGSLLLSHRCVEFMFPLGFICEVRFQWVTKNCTLGCWQLERIYMSSCIIV